MFRSGLKSFRCFFHRSVWVYGDFRGFSRFGDLLAGRAPEQAPAVSDPARSETLEDSNRILLISGGFGRISEDLRGSRKLRRDPEPAGKPTACAFWWKSMNFLEFPWISTTAQGGPPLFGPLFFLHGSKSSTARDRCSGPEVGPSDMIRGSFSSVFAQRIRIRKSWRIWSNEAHQVAALSGNPGSKK